MPQGTQPYRGYRGTTPTFAEVLETARVHWWRRTLEAEIATLHSVNDRLAQLANPKEYMARSILLDLRRNAEKATIRFADSWPKALSNAPEIRLLKTVLGFLEDSDRHREKANKTFVANELSRLREFFDRIEARPLTEEQRRAVVIDDDRNLVVAAAGSGKTSVIVAKAGWLIIEASVTRPNCYSWRSRKTPRTRWKYVCASVSAKKRRTA